MAECWKEQKGQACIASGQSSARAAKWVVASTKTAIRHVPWRSQSHHKRKETHCFSQFHHETIADNGAEVIYPACLKIGNSRGELRGKWGKPRFPLRGLTSSEPGVTDASRVSPRFTYWNGWNCCRRLNGHQFEQGPSSLGLSTRRWTETKATTRLQHLPCLRWHIPSGWTSMTGHLQGCKLFWIRASYESLRAVRSSSLWPFLVPIRRPLSFFAPKAMPRNSTSSAVHAFGTWQKADSHNSALPERSALTTGMLSTPTCLSEAANSRRQRLPGSKRC